MNIAIYFARIKNIVNQIDERVYGFFMKMKIQWNERLHNKLTLLAYENAN